MNTVSIPEEAKVKVGLLKGVIAEIIGSRPDQISETSRFSDIVGGDLDTIRRIWTKLPELVSRHIRISGNWTPTSLALEWEKTNECHA